MIGRCRIVCSLEFASDELKKDREVVLTAIRNYVNALEVVSEELRGDKEIVLAAIQQKTRSIYYT